MQLAIVPDEVNHHFESLRIPVHKNLALLLLQLMPARKHGLQRTAFDVAECRPANLEVLVAADIELQDLTQWLYLRNIRLFSFPGFALSLQCMPILFKLLDLIFQL